MNNCLEGVEIKEIIAKNVQFLTRSILMKLDITG